MSETTKNVKDLGINRKAKYNYYIDDVLECGIELKGTEVKSIKAGKFSFPDAYARIEKDQLWLTGLHITPYEFGNRFNHDPDRMRRLLVHRQEIKRLKRKTIEKGLTLIPLKFYLIGGLVKLELGLCKGKKMYDKRSEIKKRDQKRDAEKEFKYQ